MFNPSEWKRQVRYVIDKPRTVYINTHTGLPKLISTFTHEQQEALEELQRVEIYILKVGDSDGTNKG